MQRVKILEIKKLIKELDFIESNYDYIQEAVNEADVAFMSRIDELLQRIPELREKFNNQLDVDINVKTSVNESIDSNKSVKIKKLYHNIAKLTHPDIVNNDKLNSVYVTANNYYNNNDQIGLYRVCDTLNIEYEISEEDSDIIKSRIDELKSKIEFLERTFSWRWYVSEDVGEKNRIVKDFIKSRI